SDSIFPSVFTVNLVVDWKEFGPFQLQNDKQTSHLMFQCCCPQVRGAHSRGYDGKMSLSKLLPTKCSVIAFDVDDILNDEVNHSYHLENYSLDIPILQFNGNYINDIYDLQRS